MLANNLLKQAKHAYTTRKGAKFTLAQELVFKILGEHEGTIGVYDLLEKLKK